MWFYRRMMTIPWTDEKLNEDALRKKQIHKENWLPALGEDKRHFYHVLRRRQLECVVSTGRLKKKGGRGRPREIILNSLASFASVVKSIGPRLIERRSSKKDSG
ncbi:hypothetical protein BsWGS_28098 [Bradybaena similaris]